MNPGNEIRTTQLLLAVTTICVVMAGIEIGALGLQLARAGDEGGVVVEAVFALIAATLTYGFFAYAWARIGWLQWLREHRPADAGTLDAIYDGPAAPMAILVPAYREEPAVVRRTLLSAALQWYPNRRVVLLIDDPPDPRDPADRARLRAMREMPQALQRIFEPIARQCAAALGEHETRVALGRFEPQAEAAAIARLYRSAARWIGELIAQHPVHDHADALFVAAVLERAGADHRERAERYARLAGEAGLDRAAALREYRRLASLFRVGFASFERKRYANLSHALNKAMNLNSYIGLIGRRWREERAADGKALLLVEAAAGDATLEVPDATLLLTLDADSVLLPDYALRLAEVMQRPGNARMAVAQTPYSAFPGAAKLLERVAGATTDIQYLIHQGFTRYGATFWVGANALLRKSALEDIRAEHAERGYRIAKYIQDRTAIEDTESSIDLADRGWTLFNYPERLAYSATPPDFGALLIQRRRWANGGLIILPKALRYLLRRAPSRRSFAEGFFRVHYLASLALVNTALLALLFGPFDRNMDNLWLAAASVPYMVMYARDLALCGYRHADFLRVYALNLLLLPVHLAGVARSLQQALTGKCMPFGRTPKVTGRTAAPGIHVLAQFALFAAAALHAARALARGEWAGAAFGLAYAAFMAYAIVRLMGVRAACEDLRLWVFGPPAATGSAAGDMRTVPGATTDLPGKGELSPPALPHERGVPAAKRDTRTSPADARVVPLSTARAERAAPLPAAGRARRR